MIVEWLFSLATGFVAWIVTLFPTLDLPDSLVHLDDSVNGLFSSGTGLGAWIDFTAIGLLAGIPLAVWCLGLTVRAVRALIAHIPFFGGKG